MTKTLMIAAAALALTAGAAQAKPAHHAKSQATPSENAATKSLNQQQLASLESGTPPNTMPAQRSNMAPAPATGMMANDTPSTDTTPPPAPPQ